MGSSYNPKIITDGLVLCLDAANPKSYPGSGTVLADLSGNNYTGTLVNSPTYSSNDLGSFAFNGSNTSVSVLKPYPNVVGQISLCCWIKFNTFTTAPAIIHKGSHYSFRVTSATSWQYADSSNYSYANFGTQPLSETLTTSIWMNIVVTKDSSNDVRFYKNGSLLGTRLAFGSALTSVTTKTLWIGGYSDSDTAPTTFMLNGSISQASIYNRALSASEIQQNFNATRSRYGI